MPLVHEHMIIRAEVLNPPVGVPEMEDWMKYLVNDLGMKIMMGPFAAYSEMVGNRGLTVAAIIETSHIVLHAWDECSPAMLQLDVYSCAPVEKQVVLDALMEFQPIHVDYKFLNREDKFIALL
jgi:S-adenosylmethionine/arginine decarboxylase-like enzyme